MSTLLNKSYLVKVSTKGGGGQNAPNSVYMVCTYTVPKLKPNLVEALLDSEEKIAIKQTV